MLQITALSCEGYRSQCHHSDRASCAALVGAARVVPCAHLARTLFVALHGADSGGAVCERVANNGIFLA